MQGKNIVDYVDPDIEQRLLELEKEEELLEKEYLDTVAMASADSELEEDEALAVQQIRDTKKLLAAHNQLRKSTANKPRVPRTVGYKSGDQAATEMEQMGLNSAGFTERARELSRTRLAKRKRSEERSLAGMKAEDDAMDTNEDGTPARGRGRAKVRSIVRDASQNRSQSLSRIASSSRTRGASQPPSGLRDQSQAREATMVFEKKQVSRNKHEKTQRLGESDRRHFTKMPKHLFSGTQLLLSCRASLSFTHEHTHSIANMMFASVTIIHRRQERYWQDGQAINVWTRSTKCFCRTIALVTFAHSAPLEEIHGCTNNYRYVARCSGTALKYL